MNSHHNSNNIIFEHVMSTFYFRIYRISEQNNKHKMLGKEPKVRRNFSFI